MSTSAQVPGGIVSHLQGRADVIPVGESQARPLQTGDTIQPGDVILAANDTQIHVRDGAGQDWLPSDRAMAMAGGPSGKSAGKAKPQALRLDEDGPTLEEAIQALDEGRDDALPAAGLGGGGGGAMTPGLRADRVIETVSPLEFNYDTAVRSEGSPFMPVTAGFESGSGGNPPADGTPVKVNNPPQVLDPDGLHFDPVVGKYITLEDTEVSGQVKATDIDGDVLGYSLSGAPQHGTVNVNPDGTWTYTPAANYNGPDHFTVLVDDGHGGTATAVVNIGVTPVNDAPKVTDPDSDNFDPVVGQYLFNTPEDTPVSSQVKATDVDGDTLTFSLAGGPQHGTVTVNHDGTWTYIPAPNYNGADRFTVLVDDGHGGTATAVVNIGVTPVNDAPKIADPDNDSFDPVAGKYFVTTDEDTPVTGHVKAIDADGDTLSYAAGTAPLHGSVIVNADGSWVYTPTPDYLGNDRFSVTVSDGHGGTTNAVVEIGIQPVDDAAPMAAARAAFFAGTPGDGDVFAWHLSDPSPAGNGSLPQLDTITDFSGAAPSSGGDVLDLRDLLHVDSGAGAGANSVDQLLHFLDFDTQSQPGSTVIHISANGGFQADTVHGDSNSQGVADQQHIVLANVDIRASLGLDAQANDHQIIAELMQRGKLLVDQT